MEQKKQKIGYIIFMFAVCLWSVFLFAACQKQPTWQEQYDLGMRYLSESNYEEAVLAFTAAIKIDPQRSKGYVGRADAYFQTSDGVIAENLRAAEADYKQALTMDETREEAWLGLASIYQKQKDWEQAIEILQQGIQAIGTQSLQSRLEQLQQIFELTSYIGTNIYDFVADHSDLQDMGATSGIEFRSDEIIIGANYDGEITYVGIEGDGPYTILGFGYGASFQDMIRYAESQNGDVVTDSLDYQYYAMPDGTELSFRSDDGEQTDQIDFWHEVYD